MKTTVVERLCTAAAGRYAHTNVAVSALDLRTLLDAYREVVATMAMLDRCMRPNVPQLTSGEIRRVLTAVLATAKRLGVTEEARRGT